MAEQAVHAARVVEQFRGMLGERARKAVGKSRFDDLAMMIEAAIDASIVEVAEESAGIVADASKRIRELAEKPQP